MAQLPNYKPTYESLSVQVQPRVLVADFGDGYKQRVGDGINTQKEMWSVGWTLDTTSAIILLQFFRDQDGRIPFTIPFDFITGDSMSSKKYVCTQWSQSYAGPNTIRIDAQFEQSFDNS